MNNLLMFYHKLLPHTTLDSGSLDHSFFDSLRKMNKIEVKNI